MEIRIDDLSGKAIHALLEEHLRAMDMVSPPQSRHALDLTGLRHPSVTFWTLWDGTSLAGCGALKELDRSHGEIKSMRTANSHMRRGVASVMLEHILEVARNRGYERLSLETGSMTYFEPARALYASFGFEPCEPFVKYVPDENSVFMTRLL